MLLHKEQELRQLEKGEELTLDQQSVTGKQCEVTGSHYTPTTLGHDSALLQIHQLQSELEALRSCRAQEAVETTTGEDPLQLQGQEPLVSAIPILEHRVESALLGSCLCSKGCSAA